jgi:hypothetical protein
MRKHRIFTSDEEVAILGRRLLDCTLPKTEWTHAGHFAATLWILSCRPDIEAPREMPRVIRAYNVATGGVNTDTAGYHETITQASIRAARGFLGAGPDLMLAAACNALLTSPLGDPDWLLEYWSRERLFSIAARRDWCEPDIRWLPF